MKIASLETEAIECGLHTSDIIFDRKNGLVRKLVSKLPYYYLSPNAFPNEDNYRLCVGAGIDFLMQPRWGMTDSIPDSSLRITKTLSTTGDCECWIDMVLIEGVPLSEQVNVSNEVADQLADFLSKCVRMAKMAKKEQGLIVLPDLLGGVHDPRNRFANFIVEHGSDKLFFVDNYPLAALETGWSSYLDRRRYNQALTKAAGRINHSGVREQTNLLKKAIA